MKKTLLRKDHFLKRPKLYLSAVAIGLFAHTVQPSFAAGTGAHAFAVNNLAARPIKGNIKDAANGQTLPGVTVKIKGSGAGTVTDANGNFSINVEENDVLQFSYLGYDPIEIAVSGKNYIDVKLQPSVSKNLNEVVVVGYGTQKKTSTTASVSTINTQEITQKPVVNVTNSLVGRASGLIITQGSGEPGYDGSNIQIRGTSSIGRSAPLTIVDGVPRDFSRIDPNSIANISILKDAAAVAPYGVAGANGVILITTKQGKQGKPTLTYNGYYGFQNPTKVPDFVNSYEYALMRNEANANDAHDQGIAYVPFATDAELQKYKDHSDPDRYSDGHPLKDIIKPNRPITNHNITLSGGNDDVKYFASIAYTHQAGMWDPTYLNKYNGALNVTAKATSTTNVGLSVNSSVEDQHFPSFGAGTIIDQAMRQAPTTPIYYSNGLWSGYIGQSLIGEIYHSGYQTNHNTVLYTQLYIDQKLPIDGLSVKGTVSYDSGPDPLFGNNTSFTRRYSTPVPFWTRTGNTPPYTFTPGIQGNSKASFYEAYAQNISLTYQGQLNYAKNFGKNAITGLAVVEYRNINYQTFSAQRINYNLNIDELNYGGPAPSDATNGGFSSGQKQIGYVYRVGYAYDNRYLFEAAGRYDGSYLFGPGNRFGFFPAFSAGWRLSEEKFMKSINWIDNLKLRASWGQSGAYPSVGGSIQTYQYLSPYNAYGNSAVLGGTTTQGIYEALQGNPNITWEKANKTDVGFEATLWKGALGIEADYFYEKRSNMLVGVGNSLPAEYGIGVGLVNGGIMQNKGIDLTLTTFKQFSNDLRLDVKGTFTYAKNKLLQVYENSATFNNPNRRQTGRPLGEQFGLKALGYFTPNDFVDPNAASPVLKQGIPVPSFGTVRPGDLQYADLNGDGKIDANDITDLGPPSTPQIIYGIEPRLTYKNFDLDLLFQGSGKSSIFFNNYFVWPFQASGSATELAYKDHWTPSNTNALYPRLTGTPTPNNTQTSSWWLRNTSYLRLRSFEVGYTFSNKLLGRTIKSLRVYAAGQNVFTWTPHIKETFDPEQGGNNQNYFQQRVFSFGVNATF
ncbi:SusC/RagA family TonB-linked outer membrane protein [Mucilaginibacter sp. MD40]|uniref:SusC/RagA family TonB-linked outer membrane protein n=1 Tax=Mucilaginibacter sp. MD40 TaxID=2029590 RepID=UPI000BAC8D6F|nr:TonB-dependent receptor [Mucilaginibacter sp. MD40]PAW94810.1 SusC/RagA family TonB-linked outer membrane protein [Mucilaginibacter sp. MD40]